MTGHSIPQQIREQAAHWAMRQRMETLDDAQLAQLENWLLRSELHAEALAEAEMAWELSAELRHHALFDTPVPKAMPTRWQRVWRGLPGWRPVPAARWAGVCAGLLILMLGIGLRDEVAVMTADQRTAVGEIRTIDLADGSQVLLGSGSALDVDYDQGQRRVRLLRGEAMFTPAPRAGAEHRAFVVEAAGGSTQALGTRFLVRHEEGGEVWVGVLQHSIEVAVAGKAPLILQEGQGAHYRVGAFLERTVLDPRERADWTQGVLIFKQAPLHQVLERLDAFRPGHLQLLDDSQANQPVNGLFHLDNLEQSIDIIAAERNLRRLNLPGITLLY